MKSVFAILVAAVVTCCASAETVEVQLSRYFSKIDLVDGTNAVVKILDWGPTCLMGRDLRSSFTPMDNGAEIQVPCGRTVYLRHASVPFVMKVQVIPGICEVGRDEQADAAGKGTTIWFCESDRLDVRIFSDGNSAYDALSGRRLDLKLPFVNMWRDKSDMLNYFEKRDRIEYSEKIVVRSLKLMEAAKAVAATNQASQIFIPAVSPATNVMVRQSTDARVRVIREVCKDRKFRYYLYSDRESLQWYAENGAGAKQNTFVVVLQFGEDGELSKSWMSNLVPQFLVVKDGTANFCMDIEDVKHYFKTAAEAFRSVREP